MNRRVLVAGVGNVFFGDDGFGVEVARRLAGGGMPPGAVVTDFGIRGLHLAYELLEPYDALVVADAVGHGQPPGTLYVIEPSEDALARTATADAHGMNLPAVFATLRALGGIAPPVSIVGCEPSDVVEGMGLSEPVERAVGGAVQLVRQIVARALCVAAPTTEEVGYETAKRG